MDISLRYHICVGMCPLLLGFLPLSGSDVILTKLLCLFIQTLIMNGLPRPLLDLPPDFLLARDMTVMIQDHCLEDDNLLIISEALLDSGEIC